MALLLLLDTKKYFPLNTVEEEKKTIPFSFRMSKNLSNILLLFFFHSFNSHSCTLTRTRPVKFAKRIAQSATVGPFHNDRVPFLINTLDFFLPRPRICLIFSLELLKFFNGAPPNGLLNRDDISPASKTNYPRAFFWLMLVCCCCF